ncbi:MAG: hypothetical protein AVDCRST_MAG11-4179, partial [uncultured Gemmatimonadaceae bacterium]
MRALAALAAEALASSTAAEADQLRAATVAVRAGHGTGGSGVIWADDGTIVTNAHVVRGPRAEVRTA